MIKEPAFNTIALMLTIYVAALVWGMQHMSDRYSPRLLVIFFYRIALWPLIGLVVLLCLSGILLLPPAFISFLTHGAFQLPSWAPDVFSFILLIAAVSLVIGAVYQLVSKLAKATPVISWLRKRKDRIPLLEDILLNAIQRSDVRLTREALRAALTGQPDNHQAVLDWLLDHRTWLSTNWLARELISIILASPLDAKADDTYDDLLCTMLAEALDKEEFSHAKFVLVSLCNTLSKAAPWTDDHASLLRHIGFTLWKIGEHTASAPRTAKIPEQLEDLRWLFVGQVPKIWGHVLDLKSSDAVDYFTATLCDLIVEAAGTKEHCETLLARLYDVLEDGYHERLLEAQTLHELICSLMHLRIALPTAENENPRTAIGDMQTEIDEYMLASLAILVELCEEEKALHRAVGNSHLWLRITKGKWPRKPKFISEPNYYFWLSLSSYNTVLALLELPGLSKEQVRKHERLKDGGKPKLITIELETAPNGTPQLPSGHATSQNGSSTATLTIPVDQFENQIGVRGLRKNKVIG